MRRLALLLPLMVLLGGCLSDSETAGNRSVLPPPSATPPRPDASDRDAQDNPRQLCESTLEGNEPRTVCY